MTTITLTIDPGESGAFFLRHVGGPPDEVFLKNYTTIGDAHLAIYDYLTRYPDARRVAVIEDVHSSPIQGPKQAFTFGKNYGGWLAILYALKFETHLVKPQVWQKGIPGKGGKRGPELKRALKKYAEMRFPQYKITLANADALLIDDYARRTGIFPKE